MRKKILEVLMCPASGLSDFQMYAHELERENQLIYDMKHESILSEDDVKTGFIYSEDAGTVYPIEDYVLSMLTDEDLDQGFYQEVLDQALAYAPSSYGSLLRNNIERFQAAQVDETGQWNRGEMIYYDNNVRTPEQKKDSLKAIRRQPKGPNWFRLMEREEHLLHYVDWQNVSTLLEIGCGNASSLSWLAPPSKYAYQYVGTDISLQRLVLAKMVIPEGDFVQCSALRLPFKDTSFSAIVSFGVLHHLIDPLQGVVACFSKLSDDGYFMIHEPIERPTLLPDDGWHGVKRLFTSYEHSEHDGKVNVEQVVHFVDHNDVVIEHVHFSGSVIRAVLGRMVGLLGALRKRRALWKVTFFLDAIFVKFFCKHPNRMGPKSVFMFLKKGKGDRQRSVFRPTERIADL